MKENLLELNSRGLAGRWPVILGGAALTRSYVEDDLADLFDGTVRYARDAFEGLALMEPLVAIARGADFDRSAHDVHTTCKGTVSTQSQRTRALLPHLT